MTLNMDITLNNAYGDKIFKIIAAIVEFFFFLFSFTFYNERNANFNDEKSPHLNHCYWSLSGTKNAFWLFIQSKTE